MNLSLREIAALVNGDLKGDGSVAIRGVGSLTGARPGDLSFVKDARTKPGPVLTPRLGHPGEDRFHGRDSTALSVNESRAAGKQRD